MFVDRLLSSSSTSSDPKPPPPRHCHQSSSMAAQQQDRQLFSRPLSTSAGYASFSAASSATFRFIPPLLPSSHQHQQYQHQHFSGRAVGTSAAAAAAAAAPLSPPPAELELPVPEPEKKKKKAEEELRMMINIKNSRDRLGGWNRWGHQRYSAGVMNDVAKEVIDLAGKDVRRALRKVTEEGDGSTNNSHHPSSHLSSSSSSPSASTRDLSKNAKAAAATGAARQEEVPTAAVTAAVDQRRSRGSSNDGTNKNSIIAAGSNVIVRGPRPATSNGDSNRNSRMYRPNLRVSPVLLSSMTAGNDTDKRESGRISRPVSFEQQSQTESMSCSEDLPVHSSGGSGSCRSSASGTAAKAMGRTISSSRGVGRSGRHAGCTSIAGHHFVTQFQKNRRNMYLFQDVCRHSQPMPPQPSIATNVYLAPPMLSSRRQQHEANGGNFSVSIYENSGRATISPSRPITAPH